MPAARLRSIDKPMLRKASRAAIQSYFASLGEPARSNQWLALANRYRLDASSRYRDDDLANPRTTDHAQVIQYIAASAPTHAIDGWSFLSRGIEALCRGDNYTAVHIGYYAELRATMCILACEGIGILNTRHPVIEQNGTTTKSLYKIEILKQSGIGYDSKAAATHKAVWPILTHWGSLKRAADLMDGFIAPQGISITNWLSGLGIRVPMRAVSNHWLRKWGLDLSKLDEDHDSRNLVSYRPAGLRPAPPPTANAVVDFLSDLWELMSPSAGGRYVELEKALLRKVVRLSGIAVTPQLLENGVGLDPATARLYATYFSSPNEHLPLSFADKTSSVDTTNCAFEVLSRASLLLFLATSSVRKHLASAGYSQSTLEFYWKHMCITRLRGPADSLPEDAIDLWQDINESLTDAQQWSSGVANAPLGQWRNAQAEVLSHLSSFELAGVWGFVT
jgi:hypothetical protein